MQQLSHGLRPPSERGPFPGSANPGHSAGLPIQLKLQIPISELRHDGTTFVDFIITNIGTEPLKLPSSAAIFNSPGEELILWLTSDAIKNQYGRDISSGRPFKIAIVGISAELDSDNGEPKSFYVLAPNRSIRVHAFSPQLKPGTHSFTAHAELLRIQRLRGALSPVGPELIGTADSDVVKKTLVMASRNSR